MPRPLVLCRSACEVAEDRIGNSILVIAVAAQRLATARSDAEMRRLVVMIRRHAERLESFHRGLTPCDRCGLCTGAPPPKGRLLDELA